MALPKGKHGNLRPFWDALIFAYVFGFILYVFVTVYGLLSYGLSVKELVYFNFHSSAAVSMSQFTFCIVLTLTFPLHSIPNLAFIDVLFASVPYALRRVLYVGCVIAFAMAVPDVASATSLVGAIGFGLAGFVLPALCHWHLLHPLREGRYMQCMLDLVLGSIGIVAISLGFQDAGAWMSCFLMVSGAVFAMFSFRYSVSTEGREPLLD
eukprot:gnl/MRDRNA2_/MRDRNA2_145602_c0_seq1.p1 gnl/MRDRNA2_/MRDRNA2_145602_c0~~gnl/MRDRNA2_/MRDRNA2_145602_c0_seq1.p1  ORF type:complete len:234 (+),score=4.97 gnl/MRDRNA2_/MRDRNA2_145602_c0_seq1:76-702(+)